ncbi:MAG TPA: hypothetical protein VN959_03995 [Mycobacterium sp.]|nr:hypothetical protein [Mycobacterium sp.]
MQMSLNFLTSPHPATPLERLEPEQRAELIHVLARIITKAASRTEAPTNTPTVTATPTEGRRHD